MIAYTLTGVVISDDRDPSRPPLVLPLGSTSAEVEAAALSYLQPQADPDYQGFYSALLSSSVYLAVLQMPATAELARALAVFVSAIQDAMAGRENREALQGAIWLLLGQVTVTEGHIAELSMLMATYHLSKIYSLAPSTD